MLKPRDIPLASSGFRGLLNRLSGVASQFLSGDGTWRNPLNPVQTDILFTDATNDIGKTGATRPRDGFFSRNVEIGGTLNVAGNVVSDLKFTDATFDIGKSAATRPRDGFFSRTLTAGGQLDLSGAAAGQIAFPAAQNASAGANVLDDYEEGTWTPVIGGSGGTSGQTYAAQSGYYVKIGKLVIVHFNALLSAKGTITTSVQIQGLPFTVENNTNGQSIGAMQWANLATTWVSIILQGSINSTNANVVGTTVAAVGNGTALTTADINNNTQFLGTLCYRASA